ncbi:Pao retrotransposon peptidase superfamily, partial [Trichinella spiralis]|uniref:Pao retrotransposon peptidase superfamily n=1 Tax=Trichinella spiralis TaxID=6334 RepID=UPI0001EFD223
AVAYGAHGRKRLVNCLFDTGGERSLVRQDVADELKLVRLWLSPVSGEHAGERYELEAMTAPVLCEDLWQTPVSPEDWPHLQNLNLTREVGELTPVHVIIGLDSYFRFLGRQVIRGGDGDPVAVETRFGWIICGPAALSREREYRVHCIRTDDSLNAALRKFWELEAIGILPPETESGQTEMERRFKESLSFDGNRYSVGLLWKPGMASLPKNYATAIRRYRSLEKRLSRDSGLDEDYTTVMQSYFDNGWAEEAPASKTPGKTWYLPHHAVYQQGTTGRKCRIVFDGSAVHRGTSLNDQLESGPNLHVDLMGILLRFRRFRVGLHPEDRDACRFLWRGARGGKAPREYRLKQVCFRLTCSPFLAIQTIRTHAEKSQHAGDKTARLITSNMYVDDLVLSCDSIEVAKKLVQESKSLFGKGGFNLTGFVSNCSSVVGYDGALPFGKDPKPAGRLWKTLGVLWDTKSDQLSFRQLKIDAEAQDTKRTLLSLAATIFDPLGYLTPFTVRAKMLLQLLWQEGTSWDDPLPVPVAAVWRNWKGELADLSQVSIDRACIQCSLMEVAYMDLHGFADASGSAYGAVVYLRLVHGNGKVEVRFIAAKSR